MEHLHDGELLRNPLRQKIMEDTGGKIQKKAARFSNEPWRAGGIESEGMVFSKTGRGSDVFPFEGFNVFQMFQFFFFQ